MSLAKADSKALQTGLKALNKYGGSAVWTDWTAGTYDQFGNEVTPSTPAYYGISVLPLEAEQGWLDNGLMTAQQKVLMVSAKQLIDFGITYDENESITYNSVTHKIASDMPIYGGQSIILHRFVCDVA